MKVSRRKAVTPLIWRTDIGYIADAEKILFLFLSADIIGNTNQKRARIKIEEEHRGSGCT